MDEIDPVTEACFPANTTQTRLWIGRLVISPRVFRDGLYPRIGRTWKRESHEWELVARVT